MGIKMIGDLPPELAKLLARVQGGTEEEQNDDDDLEQNPRLGVREYKVSLLPEAQMMRLAEYAGHHIAAVGAPVYKRGDFVTPRAGLGIRGAGHPHIVVDVRENAEPAFINGKPDTASSGARQDMRVAVMVTNELVLCFWVESPNYEPYKN